MTKGLRPPTSRVHHPLAHPDAPADEHILWPDWTNEEQQAARAEGWQLFVDGAFFASHHNQQDKPRAMVSLYSGRWGRFRTNDDAELWVHTHAATASSVRDLPTLHQRAVNALRKWNDG